MSAGSHLRLFSSTSCSQRLQTELLRNLLSVSIQLQLSRIYCADGEIVFEGKDKAEQVVAAVEKQVQHEDDLHGTKSETAHVEHVREVSSKTA